MSELELEQEQAQDLEQDLEQRISSLSPQKRRLLELMRRGEAAQEAPPEPARTAPFSLLSDADRRRLPEELEDAYPLTQVQLGMLYHMAQTTDASTPTYHNVNSLHVRIPFDPEVFQEAVDQLVAEREVFRVSFDLTGYSEPLQLVHSSARLEVQITDLRHLPAEEQQREIDAFLREENRRLVDLSRPPLIRYHVHRRADDRFQFTLTEPHAISDGWSTNSSLVDLVSRYRTLLRGETPPPAPRLAVTYRDFVALEREALRSEEVRGFWRRKLSDYTLVPLPRWPAHLRPDAPTADRKPTEVIPASVVQGLLRLMRTAEVPFKNVTLAAHLKVMSLLSGGNEVVTGLTTNGRPEDVGGDQVRGLFLNTLPLRFRVPSGTWVDLARAALAAELELMPYRRYPLAALQRLRGGQPLFESGFSSLHFHNFERADLVGSIQVLSHGGSDLSVTHFPLGVTFQRMPPTGLVLTLELNDPALTEEQGRLFHGYYRQVLEAMADDPYARHDDRSFLSERELHQVLVRWNPPEQDFRTGECLHEIFTRQARRTPEAVAVSSPGAEPLTYGDLDRLSDRLARRLRARGVGPESLVGVSLERSPLLLVALLGVLKAGGAYVPLDPAYPQARLDYLLQDSGARLVITEEGLPDLLSGEDADGESLPSAALPGSPAYVIYTSGSTGNPKGVVVTHENVTRLFSSTREWFHFGGSDVWTLFHSFAFDFSVWEMWGALLHGGRLVVVPYLVSRSPAELYRLLVEEGVTVLNQTPSAFRQLLQAEPEAASSRELALRLVIFGGEALDPLALKPWFDRHGDERPRLINMYGITETTVHVTYRPILSAEVARGMGSWIGGPIPDLRLYCLDPQLFPVPAGVPGELHVGGSGLARGYLGRPELTAERFVPDPFGAPGARLYRSGDLARFLPDGELEYLGRADHQVKIRGFRIELGEINAVLIEHPEVRDAAVLARQDDGAEARLVAYVVRQTGAEPPSVSDLRAFLAARLPEHAVPSAFVLLDELPLTVNGKLDRRALPAPDSARPDLAVDFVAPRDAREQTLAEVWAGVLGVERVGVHDNFFSLGGDSIRSIQVIARAEERGLALTIQQLFQHPTIAGLAAVLGEMGEAGEGTAQVRTAPFELVAPEDRERLPEGLEDAYPLTRLQTGMLFHMDLNPEAPLYHNVESYHLEAPFALEPLQEALRRIIARHPVLRTSFDLSSWSEPLQLVHAHADLPLEVEDLRGLDEARQEEIIAERFDRENRVPFDLSRPPQWRVLVHRRTESTFQFTFVENHAIFDGWSLYSTLAELFRHYSALLKGTPLPEEPPPPIPFREFVAQEREVIRSEEAKAFWGRHLSGATFLQVPLWRPVSPPEPGGPNMIMSYPPVPPEVAAGLQRFASAAGLPLKNVLLAAHLKVLARLSGQEDVVTGLVMNGRAEAMGGEETRGLFLNTVPFRLYLPGGTWTELARTTLAAEQRMLPFRRYPVSELQNQMGGQPLFQTIFNYTHFHVIQGVAESGEVLVRGFRKSTETNFTLAAGFSLDSATQQLVLEVAGAAGLMPPEELEAIASWYGRALAEMAADPQARHGESSLLSRAEVHQILAEWNDTAGTAEPATLHELFERSAARDPEAVAVVGEGERITYGELEHRANRIEHRLRSLGVGPGTLVGIYLDRSPAMVPALLGVLKAGGAYVPIANGWPLSRIEWILGTHGVHHLVTEIGRLDTARELQRAVPGLAQVVCVDDPELERLPARRPRPLSDPGDLAYIIFTSGSTGRPKGVMVRHQPVVSLIGWLHETFGIGPADRVLFITSLSFDLSVYDVFGLLAAGGSIHVASSADLEEPERLVRLLRDEPVTFWDSAPAALQQLVPLFSRVPDLARSRLRLVFLSGDWIPLPLPDLVRESFPGARVISLGGATEATIWSNWYPIGRIDPRWNSIPYGRPIRNARYHVLDGGLVPCPVGAPGDLYIGGGCLSSGYAGEPALTADRYLPDPFGSDPGGRIYRTGDRARHWPDGTLEFLGRLDQQVKIRGYRIELGEIEAALLRHPEVRDACVLAREDVPGQRRLVAYVVPCDASVPEAAELRRHLQETLPEYMVPAVFVPLDALPVTRNGKLDRAALPAPDPDRSLSAREMAPPRNALEQRLARTWSEVLGIDAIGIHDNFFQIGGHSLIAIQLVTRLRESFQVDLPLRTLFDNPTVAELAEIVAQARGNTDPALLAPALPEVVPQPELLHEPFPLTDLQQAYWLGQRPDFQLGNVSAHIYEELDLPELDPARFEAAWRRLISRHPMLRAWVLPDGRQQILAEAPSFHIEVLDLRNEEPERAEAAVASVRRQMSEQGPDTSAWPLFEVRVSRLGDRRHHVHVSLSLLICDAISGGLLTRELILFYADPAAALPPVEVSFRDYVLSLGAFEESEAYQRSLRYWTERVPALPPAPELPVLAELRGEPRFVRRTRVIETQLWERLKARAGQAGVTPTVAVLAAYSEVLAAWSKSPGFTLNLLFFNRFAVHPQINQVVGNFSSTTLLEVDAARGDSFEARAGRLQDQLWKDLEHSRVTGVRVLREIARQQGASSRPAMPVVFTSDIGLERGGQDSQEGASVASWGALQTPHVWLDHQVSERQGRLILNWDVVETLFPEEMVDRMFEAYCGLVASLAEPDAWRSTPPRLVPAAHLDLYAAINATGAPVPEGLLHGLFLRQAQERPEAPAVLAADRTLTYGELLREASRVAHRLRQLGARPGMLVAVVMEKGWEQVVGALGVLLSGAAYLPVDPQVPGERLRYLLKNGEARLALAQSRFAETLDWPEGIARLPLDAGSFEGEEETPPPSVQRPDDLAYVIFTSGSTGQPKGVAIEHRAALNTILDVNRRFGVGPEDRVLALSALNFDLSVYDLFGLLAAGGAIVLPEPASLREPARWAELMSEHRVSLWNSVPALMEMLVDDLEGRSQPLPSALRLAMLSGDWIPVRLPDRIRALSEGSVATVSLGGATEASIWSILHPIDEVDPRWTSIPYGRPMVNQTLHVLGADLEPRPVWVPGELCIGGAGLAREYWRDEERTAASFFLRPDTGERLYRTGDLGRWLPDGAIEFLGREDLQVKIQGYRIELGEIEAALSQHPGVRLCAAAALGARGSRRLVAWYVADRSSPDAADLAGFLARKLPPYMIPTAFVELEEMPLTPNGKVDRRALPEPDRIAGSAAEQVPPRDELEVHIAAIWQDLLGLPSVGIRDGFFDLGGHSLLAVRLMSRIRAELGQDLPLATLFEAGTVESLAAVLRKESTGERTPLVLIRRGEGRPLFLVHPVGGSVLCYRDLSQALGAGPVWALQSTENPPPTLEEMAAVYLQALRAAQPQGPYRLAGWSMGGTLAYEMARQLRSNGEEVEQLVLIDASVPGAEGPVEVDDATLASWFARDLGGLAGRSVHLPPEDLRGLTSDEQVRKVLETAVEAGALAPGLGVDELHHHLEIFRRNFRALLSYVPGPYSGSLQAIVAEEAPADAAAPWRSLAGRVEEHRVPGDHYTVVQPPQVEELARLLNQTPG